MKKGSTSMSALLILFVCLNVANVLFLSEVSATPLTAEEKVIALARHNLCRCTVLPTAKSMPAVIWDPLLEAVSQAYIDTCPSSHNTQATVQYNSMGGQAVWVGENLAFGFDNLADAIDLGWCNEKLGYIYETNNCTGGVCGHYTQVVWAETLRIGCSKPSGSCPGFQGAYYICNYAIGGNFQGVKPYESGLGNNSACAALNLSQVPILDNTSITLLRRGISPFSSQFAASDNITTITSTKDKKRLKANLRRKTKVSSAVPPMNFCSLERDLASTAVVSASSVFLYDQQEQISNASLFTTNSSIIDSMIFKPENVIDGRNTTFWRPGSIAMNSSEPEWIELDLGSMKLVSSIQINFNQLNTSSVPISFTVQISQSGNEEYEVIYVSSPTDTTIATTKSSSSNKTSGKKKRKNSTNSIIQLKATKIARYVRVVIDTSSVPIEMNTFRVWGKNISCVINKKV